MATRCPTSKGVVDVAQSILDDVTNALQPADTTVPVHSWPGMNGRVAIVCKYTNLLV